ncbi:unnamed protein product [Staurois parvus]|uniref:Uncharacterized protein n=1 Tax=Staurois parvus TaxID=386267 RepID=A0ABN9H5H3_9NEOB|nr:unnamed protein product [Staurois parvus]
MVCLYKFILDCNFYNPPNLRNKLISRKLPSDYDVANNGSKPCNKKRCKLCNQINPSKSVRHSKRDLQYFRFIQLHF